ncbi:hypothetical protein CY0110_16572 [Crocosphaera chwakensis CCY0110]|uniref:Uncharacterized protein n=1 Tax=Crocosphaera chwakensis CCY0110 TaxID=391612 RepID=A3IHZ6_9CHRO|nr:hypothetical protein CY0110_16572 [Crocosphaera chwakensis CCY0110]
MIAYEERNLKSNLRKYFVRSFPVFDPV